MPDTPIPEPSHVHDAKLLRLHDGDTFVVLADLGYYLREFPLTVRVHALHCPELKEPGGPEARDFAIGLLAARKLRIRSYKDEQSYNRWICDVWVKTVDGDWTPYAEAAIAAGHGTAEKQPGSGR